MRNKYWLIGSGFSATLFVVWYFILNYIPEERLKMLDIIEPQVVETGLHEMEKHKVIICGITRDNDVELSYVIKHIENTGEHFNDYRVVLFENDSRDNTKDILKEWQKANPKVRVITKYYGNKKRPNLGFLANARNHYINEIKNNPAYYEFDIVMIIDMDMVYGWDMRGIADSFAKINNWDGVCSNGISNENGVMYDLFAFRSKEFPQKITSRKMCKETWPTTICERVYHVGTRLVSVDSCFGGMAFYKRKFIGGCDYKSIDEDCEHITFHMCLKNKGGRMVMNPSQIIRYTHYTPLSYKDVRYFLIKWLRTIMLLPAST